MKLPKRAHLNAALTEGVSGSPDDALGLVRWAIKIGQRDPTFFDRHPAFAEAVNAAIEALGTVEEVGADLRVRVEAEEAAKQTELFISLRTALAVELTEAGSTLNYEGVVALLERFAAAHPEVDFNCPWPAPSVEAGTSGSSSRLNLTPDSDDVVAMLNTDGWLYLGVVMNLHPKMRIQLFHSLQDSTPEGSTTSWSPYAPQLTR